MKTTSDCKGSVSFFLGLILHIYIYFLNYGYILAHILYNVEYN